MLNIMFQIVLLIDFKEVDSMENHKMEEAIPEVIPPAGKVKELVAGKIKNDLIILIVYIHIKIYKFIFNYLNLLFF